MSRTAFGQVHRAAAGSSAWRGLSLQLSAQYDYNGTATVVPFDTVLADTDSIYNGTDGGVVPVGMAGLWRRSAQAFFVNTGGVGATESALFSKNSLASFLQQNWEHDSSAVSEGRAFPPFIEELAEGDEIQLYVGNGGSDAAGGGFDTYMVMEYLGPAPAPPS